MTLTTSAFISLIGALFGASLMLLAVARSESWRWQQGQQAAAKLERVRNHWHDRWLAEARRADEAEAKLAAIHQKHVEAGKARHRKEREKVLAKAAEMRAELEQSNVVAMDMAA